MMLETYSEILGDGPFAAQDINSRGGEKNFIGDLLEIGRAHV
jgi:hypothetical protein